MKAKFQPTMLVLALVTLAVVISASQGTRAAGPWYVAPGGNDSNTCASPGAPCATINGAIGKASSGDTIYVAAGTYIGAGAEVVLLDKNVTLSGGWNATFALRNGMSTVDGQALRRCVSVRNGATVTIERFILRNGTSDEYGVAGGIDNSQSAVTVNHCQLSGNRRPGIYNYLGTVTLNNSTISDNIASGFSGAGITNAGTMTVNNSTISGNVAGSLGGGIHNDWFRTIVLNNTTVNGNRAADSGGGISNNGTLTMQNTLVAGNTASSGPDCRGTIGSTGYNLIENASGCTFTPTAGDLVNVSPQLGPLIGAAGAPRYHPLLSGSPAINAGNPSGCTGSTGPLTTDQRGAARVGRCDIGAYEYTVPGLATSLHALAGTPQRTFPLRPFAEPFQAVALDSVGSPVSNTVMTFSAPSSGASGIFTNTGTHTMTATTSEGGVTTASAFVANELTGSYVVTAVASGVITPASFLLSNSWGLYTAPDGDDNRSCLRPEEACTSIDAALGKASPGDTIFVATGVYTGTLSQVVLLNRSVTLSGGWNNTFTAQNGASRIDGEGARRGITVDSGAIARIERFIVQNGSGDGGGIRNDGTLTLSNSTVSGNTAGPYGRGGGILNYGLLTLNNSTMSDNSAWFGGGIYACGTQAVNNSTITNNSADSSSGTGGGIYACGTTMLQNTILAGNSASGEPDCTSQADWVQSSGYNLVGTPCFTPGPGDLTEVDPKLGPLDGSPAYHPLLLVSPAINAGNPTGCKDDKGNPLPTDQRGLGRFGRCDIGAYEVQPIEYSTKTVSPLILTFGKALTWTIVLTNGGTTNITAANVSDMFPISLTYTPGSLTATSGDYGYNNGVITWTGAIQAGKAVTITFGAISGQTEGVITNSAVISDAEQIITRSAHLRVIPPRAYLPCITRACTLLYTDDFGNPASGWPTAEDANAAYGYLNGEYRIVEKQTYKSAGVRPGFKASDLVAVVDVRNAAGVTGYYGIMFGIADDWSQSYFYWISSFGYYGISRYNSSSGWLNLLNGPSSYINSGAATNRIKVERNGSQIKGYVNGHLVAELTDSTYTGLRHVGLGVMSSSSPNAEARFDNLAIYPSGCGAMTDYTGASAAVMAANPSGDWGGNQQHILSRSNHEFIRKPPTAHRWSRLH